MKKLLISLLLGLAILTGCQSEKKDTQVQSLGEAGIDGKSAGTLLVNAMIYQKDIDKMKDNFGGAEMLLHPNGKGGASYSETIVSGMLQSTSVTKSEKQTIAQALDQEVVKKTSYQIKEAKKSGKEWLVTYEIKGLNFIQAMATATRNTLEKVVQDPGLVGNAAELEKRITAGFPASLAATEGIPVAQTLEIKLVENDEKWSVDSSQQGALNQLLMAFYVGEVDEKVASEKVQSVMTNLMSEYMEKALDSSSPE